MDGLKEKIDKVAASAAMLPGVVIIHHINGSVVWMCERGLNQLGLSLKELCSLSPQEYYKCYFNEEDAKDYVPRILDLLERNDDDETITYFQQVKLTGSPDWTWHMSSSRIFFRDNRGKVSHTITLSFPIDAMHHMTAKAERLLDENNFLRRNFQKFSRLSDREKQVLRQIALGKSSAETAEMLFISLSTVDTHRKNIRKKLGGSSYYELSQYARAFDLI